MLNVHSFHHGLLSSYPDEGDAMVVRKVVEEYVGHLQGSSIGEHAFHNVSWLAVDDRAPGAGGVHLVLSGCGFGNTLIVIQSTVLDKNKAVHF